MRLKYSTVSSSVRHLGVLEVFRVSRCSPSLIRLTTTVGTPDLCRPLAAAGLGTAREGCPSLDAFSGEKLIGKRSQASMAARNAPGRRRACRDQTGRSGGCRGAPTSIDPRAL